MKAIAGIKKITGTGFKVDTGEQIQRACSRPKTNCFKKRVVWNERLFNTPVLVQCIRRTHKVVSRSYVSVGMLV